MAAPMATSPHLTPGYCAGLPWPLPPTAASLASRFSRRTCPLCSATLASSLFPISGPFAWLFPWPEGPPPDTHGTHLLTSFRILTNVTFSFLDKAVLMSLMASLPHSLCSPPSAYCKLP